MTKSNNVHSIVLRSVSPIAHADTASGVNNASNTTLFMRTSAYVNGFPALVPAISENALRSVIWRKTLADHLLTTIGAEPGTMRKSVVNLLYSGGNIAGGSKAPGNELHLGRELMRMYPSIDLLGGAVDCFVLPKSRLTFTYCPVAREFAMALSYVAPKNVVAEAESRSIFDAITEETRTRGTGNESEGNQMIYSYEVMAAGVGLFVRVTLDNNCCELTRTMVFRLFKRRNKTKSSCRI